MSTTKPLTVKFCTLSKKQDENTAIQRGRSVKIRIDKEFAGRFGKVESTTKDGSCTVSILGEINTIKTFLQSHLSLLDEPVIIDDSELGFMKSYSTKEVKLDDNSDVFSSDNENIQFRVWRNQITGVKKIIQFLKQWGSECQTMTVPKEDDEASDKQYVCHKFIMTDTLTRCTLLHFEKEQLQFYIIYYNHNDIEFSGFEQKRWYNEFIFLALLLNATKRSTDDSFTINKCISHILEQGNCKYLLGESLKGRPFKDIRIEEAGTQIATRMQALYRRQNAQRGVELVKKNQDYQTHSANLLDGIEVSEICIEDGSVFIVKPDNTKYQIKYEKGYDVPKLMITDNESEGSALNNALSSDFNKGNMFINLDILGNGVLYNPQGTYHSSGKQLPDDEHLYMLFHVHKNNKNTIIRYVKPDNPDDFLVNIKGGKVTKGPDVLYDDLEVTVLVFTRTTPDTAKDETEARWEYYKQDNIYFNSSKVKYVTQSSITTADDTTKSNQVEREEEEQEMSGGTLPRRTHISRRHTRKHIQQPTHNKYSRRRVQNHI